MILRSPRGFTLIELLVAMALGVILLLLALPAYVSWTSDAEVSSAASSIADGLRTAASEAIKRNTNVEFLLVSGGWTTRLADSGDTITSGHFAEGAKRATATPLTTGTVTVTFNALGGTEAKNADATVRMNAVEVNAPDAGRKLLVVLGDQTISLTGVRVCDPKFLYPDDPKGCPPPS
jgi:type IV fimbrial biogenesis protein FimT